MCPSVKFADARINVQNYADSRKGRTAALGPKPLFAFTPFVTLQKSGFSAFGTSESLLL
jgi:hypothetical protein